MKTKLLVTLIWGISASFGTQAALFDRGGGMIYDSTQNITWVADANLFATQFAGNANLVSDIIIANGGVVLETPDPWYGRNGTHNLVASDFYTETGPMASNNITIGSMTWWGAQAWANSLTVGGFSDWRLPTTTSATGGWNQANSEMGNLFYNELGGVAYTSISTNHNANYNLFSNIQDGGPYYSGTEWAPHSIAADAFTFNNSNTQAGAGYEQIGGNKDGMYYAWAVRTGDVSAVPVPGAVWLFGTGLMGLTGLARKRKAA
jgi:hypothetical protein